MKAVIKELYGELVLVLRGKTLDLLLPPIVFYLMLSFRGLNEALIVAVVFAVVLNVYRLVRKEKWWYALLGMLGVIFASVFAYLNQNAANYFLPDMIGNVVIVIIVGLSLVFKKPLAAYASHITRGFPIEWFWRKDVYPAYKEVTMLWLLYLSIRGSVEITLYASGNIEGLVLFSTFAGIPLLVGVLITSYIYGLWRLRTLKGPSVDEFLEGKEPPYDGQKKGF